MSNLIYPDLPGLSLPVQRMPAWKNRVVESDRRFAKAFWSYPRWTTGCATKCCALVVAFRNCKTWSASSTRTRATSTPGSFGIRRPPRRRPLSV